jgi:hypothetical protein
MFWPAGLTGNVILFTDETNLHLHQERLLLRYSQLEKIQ